MAEPALVRDLDRACAVAVYDRLCRHTDGLGVGSTVAALQGSGILAAIAGGGVRDVAELSRSFAAREGFLSVALRLLADQGWVSLERRRGQATIAVTQRGRSVLPHADHYRPVEELLGCAARLVRTPVTVLDTATSRSLERACALLEADWGLSPDLPAEVRGQIGPHLDGHLVAPALVRLIRTGVLVGDEDRVRLPADDAAALAEAHLLLRILRSQRWICDVDRHAGLALTDPGRLAVSWSAQYWYPLSYIATFRRVPELLFGGSPAGWTTAPPHHEPHIDRALDLDFSGEVFSTSCEAPTLELVLPLFDARRCRDPPTLIVDTGCGDGRLLEAVHRGVDRRTRRGRDTTRAPPFAVGVDSSAVARTATAERLSAANIPHTVIDGDVGQPEAIVAALSARGLDPTKALHLSKSVFHDRSIAEDADPPPTTWPHVDGAFARPDGSTITPSAVAADLRALLRRWREVVSGHGMVVIEVHAIATEITARALGQTFYTALDAGHGYSHQYLVGAEVFAWAVAEAGFAVRSHREPVSRPFGACPLTIDHLVSGADA